MHKTGKISNIAFIKVMLHIPGKYKNLNYNQLCWTIQPQNNIKEIAIQHKKVPDYESNSMVGLQLTKILIWIFPQQVHISMPIT